MVLFSTGPWRTRKPLLISKAMLEAKRQAMTKFSGSDDWFSHWRWHFDISKCVKLHGEAGDVDLKAAEHEFQKLRIEIGKYPPSNVFNMDEAGLFFKAIPNHSYMLQNEGDVRQTGRGIKSMTAQERLCVNATGSCKVTPVVIGCPEKPHCFNIGWPPPVYHIILKRMHGTTLRFIASGVTSCLYQPFISIPRILYFFLLDNFSGHDYHCIDPKRQVEVLKLPPNDITCNEENSYACTCYRIVLKCERGKHIAILK